MTDRHSGYVVSLDHDIREDDAEAVLNALKMIKGVLSVSPVMSEMGVQMISESRRDEAWRTSLYRLISTGPSNAK